MVIVFPNRPKFQLTIKYFFKEGNNSNLYENVAIVDILSINWTRYIISNFIIWNKFSKYSKMT